ncbi:hypothetical protein CDG62_00405 (plasmid) [Acinetobacter sp. WCHA55]|uniref:defense against restriction DarA-related protein n=1 Tax=Acinetobacter sp. WCHA55 TaxID=2004646 RepID=UPI000B3BED9E|nr:hypothetical protein [Acinetobacter sp. WCHA55]AYA66922.1 hypothetical protein CDG62_00405 [Acinetobacter sp. WCHA55]
MLKHPLFTPKFTTGQNVKIIKPSSSAMLDSCEANIGQLSGVARSISAILCDGSDEHDQWQLMNVIDSTGALLDHVAIKGAVSSEQAIRLCGKYLPELQTGSIRNVVPMTDSAIKTFLDGANIPSGTPFVLASDALELDSIGATKSVEWVDGCIRSHGGSISQLMMDMRRCDPEGQLLEHVTPRDIIRLVIDDSCEFGPMLDAMIIKHRNLQQTVTRMAEALKAYDNEEFFVKTVTPIEPFKRNGVANVGAIFEMSDSQKITVLFANPDSTPAKLSSDDVLTSWKWMLNKRDVTAILQPRAVDAKKYNVIAERMTRLLARNHKKFKDAQASRAKDELLLSELVGQVEADQLELRTLDAQYNAIQQEIDAEATRKLNQTEIGKAGESGLTAEGAEKFHTDLKATLENEQNVQLSKEQLIVNKATALKDLLIAEHGFTDDRTAKRNTHAFVLDTPNKNRLTISAFIDETYNDQWVFSAWLGAGDTNILKDLDTSQDIEQIAQQIVEADNLNPNTTNEQGKQNVQMNKSENTALYEIKNGRKKEGTIKVTKDGDTYTAFVSIAGVGGEFVGDLNQVKSWLAVRLQRLGESVEGASLSWESTASRLKLKSGEDYLNLSEAFVTFDEVTAVTSKVDLAKLIAKKLSKMDGWSMSGSTAIRDVTLNGQTYKYKFNFAPLASTTEFRIDEVLMDESRGAVTDEAIVTYGMFTPSREGVELAVKSLFEGVNSHIEHQLENNTQSDEQDVQMNNDDSQNNNAVSDDQQFLERVVAGTEDMSSADFGDKLIAIAENLDPALEALFEQATDAYANYAISLEV